MAEQERFDNLSLQVFAGRFQEEELGLVYYPSGLGRGGRTVAYDEANSYITEYARLLDRNKRWLTLSAKLMIAGLFVSVLFGYFWSLFAAAALLTASVGFYFANWVNAMFGPTLFERRLGRNLNRRIASMPLSRTERIERGFAWPLRKSLVFYGVGGPALLFFMLHRAGPHGLLSLLGPELAHQYDIAIKLFVIGLFLIALVALPFMWWKQRKKTHRQN